MDGGRLPVGSSLDALPPTRVAAAVSVNDAELERLRTRLPRLRVVGEDIPLQVPVRYRPPEDLGRDRVMSVVGALHRCPEAQGVLVVDLGTCMTFTLGLREEGILGGAILPGPDLQSRALAQWTARLPLVEPRTRGEAARRARPLDRRVHPQWSVARRGGRRPRADRATQRGESGAAPCRRRRRRR